MPNRDQMRRILEIDHRIRAGEYPHPETLALELEVSRRVIFNDRAYLLNTLGAPLEFHRERGGWYYTEPTYALPSAIVTRGELLVFLLGVEAARRQLGPALEKELQEATDKIARSLKGKVEVNFASLSRHFSFASPSAAAASEATLLALHEAIERQKAIEMTYFSAHRGATSRRRVEPHHLHNASGDWLLFAFDSAKGKMLTFNAARIEHLELLAQTFVRQPDFSPDEFLKSGFRAESGAQVYETAVRFSAAQAIYVRERFWHATQTLEELPGGEVVLRLKSSGLGELARWVLQYGPNAEVLSPPELRELVASQVRATARMYA